MDNIKILHFADSHLGSTFPGLGRKGRQRGEEILNTFRRIISYARKEEVDVILIAGDFIEASSITDRVIQLIKETLLTLPDTKIFIAPGNHDYYSIGSPYGGGWPSHVHIFRTPLEIVDIPELNTTVVGSAFLESHQRQSNWDRLLNPNESYLNQLIEAKYHGRHVLGVFHGEVISDGQPSLYNPLQISRLPEGLFDYIALGHIHKRTPIQHFQETSYAYSGNPDGTSFNGTGPKGVYIGRVGKMGVDLQFKTFSSRGFFNVAIDVGDYQSQVQMEETIIQKLGEQMSDFEDHFYRFLLQGKKQEEAYWSTAALAQYLSDRLYHVEVVDESEWAFDLESLLKQDNLEAHFIRTLMDKKERVQGDSEDADKQRRIIDRAITLGLQALSGGR